MRRAIAMSMFAGAMAGLAVWASVGSTPGSHLWQASVRTTVVGVRVERWSIIGIVLRMRPRPPFRRLPPLNDDRNVDDDLSDPYTRGSRLVLGEGHPDHLLAGFGYT